MKHHDTLDIYIATIPDRADYRPILPPERQAMIDATRNESVKAQKYLAWDTLLKGLKNSRGLDATTAGLSRTERGKWISTKCGISISHCRTAVAAAIFERATGVDIEPFEDPRYREAILFRIATEAERKLFPSLPAEQRIAVLWTRKEAAFKRSDRDLPTPIEADAADQTLCSIRIRLDGVDYVISAAAEEEVVLRVFEVRGDTVAERSDFELLHVLSPV